MPKQLIIHVGTPKTGSTSFQNVMMDNHLSLREHGVYFPFDPRFFGPDYHQSQFVPPAHSEILLEWLDFQRDYPFLGIDWPGAFQRFRTDDALHTMVVSHESLSALSSRFKPDAFATWTRDLNPRFLICLRHPLDYLASHFKEAVIGLAGFAKPPHAHPNYKRYVQEGFRGILDRLGNMAPVTVLSYDRLTQENRLMTQMLSCINAPETLAQSAISERANEKPVNTEALILINHLNVFHTDPDLRTRFAQTAPSATGSIPVRPEYIYAPQEEHAILEAWQNDQIYLAQTHWFDAAEPHRTPPRRHTYRLTAEETDRLTPLIDRFSAPDAALLERALDLATTGAGFS